MQFQINAIVSNDAAEPLGDILHFYGVNSFQGCHPFSREIKGNDCFPAPKFLYFILTQILVDVYKIYKKFFSFTKKVLVLAKGGLGKVYEKKQKKRTARRQFFF